MNRVTALSCVLLVVIIVSLLQLLLVVNAETWPWGEKEEPFPWLDYLANRESVLRRR